MVESNYEIYLEEYMKDAVIIDAIHTPIGAF